MNQASHALEEIRRTEMKAARRIEDSRARAEEIIEEAREDARRRVDSAREEGRQEAQRRLEQAIAEAEAAAASIRTQGLADAAEVSGITDDSLAPVVEEMVRVVLAPPSEPGS